MKTTILKLVLMIFLLSISNVESFAQKVSVKSQVQDKKKDKDKDKDKNKDKNKKSIPIDGGIGLLLAAGVGLGAFKFIKRRNENKL